MTTTNNRILKLFKSRQIILDQLEELQYDTSEHHEFSINEIDAMNNNSQLDMLISHNDDGRKVYVKYYLAAKQIRPPNLDDIIDDLYNIDNILTKKDTLIVITDDEPNDTIISKLKYLYDHDGIFVVIHNINRLQYNILKHALVPEAYILGDTEVAELKKTYNILDVRQQLPEISRFDPQSLAICMRPGQVCRFKRDSLTAMTYNYYRICV